MSAYKSYVQYRAGAQIVASRYDFLAQYELSGPARHWGKLTKKCCKTVFNSLCAKIAEESKFLLTLYTIRMKGWQFFIRPVFFYSFFIIRMHYSTKMFHGCHLLCCSWEKCQLSFCLTFCTAWPINIATSHVLAAPSSGFSSLSICLFVNLSIFTQVPVFIYARLFLVWQQSCTVL